jgi:hypothetical protein
MKHRMRISLKMAVSLLVMITSMPGEATMLYRIGSVEQDAIGKQPPFYIQCGSFKNLHYANTYAKQLRKSNRYPVKVSKKAAFHHVIIGPIPSLSELQHLTQNNIHQPVQVNSIETSSSNTVAKASVVNKMKPLSVTPAIASYSPLNFNSSWIFTVGAGVSDLDLPKNLYVGNGSDFPPPFNVDLFTIKEKDMTTILAAVSYGWFRHRSWLPAWSLGLRYQHLFSENIGGTITQYSLPEFLNYTYQWDISSNVWTVSAKLDLFEYAYFKPYVDGGLGVADNTAKRYRETALAGVTPRESPGFGEHTTTQFTYHLGAGLDIPFNDHVTASVGYEFQDLGSVSSFQGQTSWAAERLNLDRYRANTFFLSVSYVFGAAPAAAFSK